MYTSTLSRRSFSALVAATPLLARVPEAKHMPIGLELYTVREQLKKDVIGTVQAVGQMGYECVEFYAPYYDWTLEFARTVRAQLDNLGVRCYSTHNSLTYFSPSSIGKAIELNHILGTRYMVLAHPGDVKTIDDWKRVIGQLNQAHGTLVKETLAAGYHNHDLEWRPVDGQKPIELIAATTEPGIMLQLDVGTCVATGNDPVAWVEKNPKRVRSLHLKDWSPEKGYRALFGEGVVAWKKLFDAASATGSMEYFLMEQEDSDFPELEDASRCLIAYRKLMS